MMGNYYPSLILRLLVLGLPLSTFAQNSIPTCAIPCYDQAVSLSGCGTDDLTCQCGEATQTTTVQTQLSSCLQAACSNTEISDYNIWATTLCDDLILSSFSSALYSLTASLSDYYTSIPITTATTTKASSVVTVPTSITTATTAKGVPTVTASPVSNSAESSSGSSSSGHANIALIAGASVGGVFVLSIIVLGIIFFCWRRSKSKAAKRLASSNQQQAQFQQQPLIPPPQYQSPAPTFQNLQQPPTMAPVPPVQQSYYEPPQPEKNPISPPVVGAMEMEGEGRGEFVEIAGHETVIRGDSQRPAELYSEQPYR